MFRNEVYHSDQTYPGVHNSFLYCEKNCRMIISNANNYNGMQIPRQFDDIKNIGVVQYKEWFQYIIEPSRLLLRIEIKMTIVFCCQKGVSNSKAKPQWNQKVTLMHIFHAFWMGQNARCLTEYWSHWKLMLWLRLCGSDILYEREEFWIIACIWVELFNSE